jgi:acetyl esterase/lipase
MTCSAVNYRKALSPSTAFPADLLDLVAGYIYLICLGFRPENITLCGDSSGAHLMLALTRYISELMAMDQTDIGRSPNRLGMPGAVMLISVRFTKQIYQSIKLIRSVQPSCDLSHPPRESIPTDYLSPHLNRLVYPSLARHYPSDALQTNPYFSPAICGSFEYLAKAQTPSEGPRPDQTYRSGSISDAEKGLVAAAPVHGGTRVWVQYGDGELLTPDIRGMVGKMTKEGVSVEVDLVQGGCHLDAGIAFALGERSNESSWIRLLEAAKRY